MVKIGNGWQPFFDEEIKKKYYQDLRSFLVKEYKNKTIYPNAEDIFNIYKEVSPESIRVVILGQDPYHGTGQAHGMAFSVKPGVVLPPSLKNIFKEIYYEFNIEIPCVGFLLPWARQGVFLLNSSLTVEESRPNSHSNIGWETLTNNTISYINNLNQPVVFLLWGGDACSKKKLITNSNHFILEAPHPSPLSAHRGFFGCNHFKKANKFLKDNGFKEINWNLSFKKIN